MKVVLVLSKFPKLSETFVVSKFVGILERGWDVHVVCGEIDRATWSRFPGLSQRLDVRKRVHAAWPQRPRYFAALLFPLVLFRCFILSPSSSLRYFRKGWPLFHLDIFRRFYLDADLIALSPALISFVFGTLAKERMYLKELLNCSIVASFRGYDL